MLKNCGCCSDFEIWDDVMETGEENQQGQHEQPQSLPLSFIQVLIHQHAKTLVALKSLKSEVKTLTQQPITTTPGSIATNIFYQNDRPDSGFTSKSSSGDELYSLLNQIQEKVVQLKPRKRIKQKLGYLDNLFGNEHFDFNRFQKIDKNLIKQVLSCDDDGELRRQLLFCGSRVECLTEESEKLKKENEELRRRVNELEKSGEKNKVVIQKSLNSFNKSLIPVSIARKKIVNNKDGRFLWGQWFN